MQVLKQASAVVVGLSLTGAAVTAPISWLIYQVSGLRSGASFTEQALIAAPVVFLGVAAFAAMMFFSATYHAKRNIRPKSANKRMRPILDPSATCPAEQDQRLKAGG